MLEHFFYNINFKERRAKVNSNSTKNEVDSLLKTSDIAQEIKKLVVSNHVDLFGRVHLETSRKPCFWIEIIINLLVVCTKFYVFEIRLLLIIAFAIPKCYLRED